MGSPAIWDALVSKHMLLLSRSRFSSLFVLFHTFNTFLLWNFLKDKPEHTTKYDISYALY
jgi:hypothetical protein